MLVEELYHSGVSLEEAGSCNCQVQVPAEEVQGEEFQAEVVQEQCRPSQTELKIIYSKSIDEAATALRKITVQQ